MKKLITNKNFIIRVGFILALLFIMLFMTGCNKQVVDFDYSFDKAICNIGGETKEFELKTWKDYEGEQLQLVDKKGNKYLVSSFNCTLVKEG